MTNEIDITCQQADELITGFVDGELDNSERRTIQIHLPACPQCQEHYDRERQLKFLLLRSGLSFTAPLAFTNGIKIRLTDSSVVPDRTRLGILLKTGMARLLPRVAAAGAFALLLITAAFVFNNPAPAFLVPELLHHYRNANNQGSAFIASQDLLELQSTLSRAVGGEFKPMAYDFNAMGTRLIGGVKMSMDGRPVLLMIYQGNGVRLHCYTFKADSDEITASHFQFFDAEKNVRFYQFTDSGVHGVLHREGDVLCLLSSTMPMARLLRWARVKAHRNLS